MSSKVPRPSAAARATIEVILIALDPRARPKALLDELDSLHGRGVIKVVDAIVIRRETATSIHAVGKSGLARREVQRIRRLMTDSVGYQPTEFEGSQSLSFEGSAALLGPLDIKSIAEMLRPGQEAVVVILEHEWASRLGRLIRSHGVRLLEDYLLTPETLRGTNPGISMW